MSEKEIEVRHLTFQYEQNDAVLQDVSFQAESGEAIGLIGANGAGKSTLLKLLVGLQLQFEGSILIKGLSMEKGNLERIRADIGYVFQDSDSQLFMTTVSEDVAFAPANYGLPPEEVGRRVQAALERVHIAHLKEKSIYKLSGGEKKLVSIATILSMTPDIILMDEPSAALDPRNRRNLIEVVNELDPLKIIASHDLDFIRDTCGRVILLDSGVLVKDGPAERILTDRALLEEHGLELPLSLQSAGRDS